MLIKNRKEIISFFVPLPQWVIIVLMSHWGLQSGTVIADTCSGLLYIVQSLATFLQYSYQFYRCLRSEHLDARPAEVRDALEYGRRGKMSARV